MRPVKGLGLLAALTIALSMVAIQPAVAPAANKVQAASSAQLAIANLARANLNKGPCDVNSQGRWYFTAPDGVSSCSYPTAWCGEFTAWVWDKSGHVNTAGVGHTPTSIYNYGTRVNATGANWPQIGDAVVFATPGGGSTPGHVGIVYSIDFAAYKVTVIAGNEGSPARVGYRTFYYNRLSTSTPSPAYRPMAYITPWLH